MKNVYNICVCIWNIDRVNGDGWVFLNIGKSIPENDTAFVAIWCVRERDGELIVIREMPAAITNKTAVRNVISCFYCYADNIAENKSLKSGNGCVTYCMILRRHFDLNISEVDYDCWWCQKMELKN